MDKQNTVIFRNVGQIYFPQTRVECHYSLTSDHQWNSSDWIGIFEVGWSSLKDYYTYTWALVPESYTEGTDVNFCALFQSSYLPRPSAVDYQFVYVDKDGEVCAHSRPFTFCAPKPLEELETLKEEQDEEDGGEEMLLVIPRAQLLQSRLEECVKEKEDMQQALDMERKEMKDEREKIKKERMEWECERETLKEEIDELRDTLRDKCGMLKKIEGKHNDVKYSQENLNSELSKLSAEKNENEQRIKDLEDDIKVLTNREKEENTELERLKERMKKMSSQMKHDEEKRKLLQVENEAALAEARVLQDRLDTSEHLAETLRRELRELGARQGLTHTELHQARLQVAQLTLQLSEENLVLREERANWALEREAYKHAAEADKKKLQEVCSEVQRKEEWLREERMEREKLEVELERERDCGRVLLSEAKREVHELKVSLKKVLREKEEMERQDVVKYIHQLERSGIVPESKSSEDANTCNTRSSSSEDDEATADSDAQSEKSQCGEGKKLMLPEFVDPVLSELADSHVW